MFGSIANGLADVLSVILTMIQIVVIASVVVSWVSADPNNQIVRIIYNITEPLYRPIRRLTSRIPGPFDWAPIGVLLVVIFLQSSLVRYLKMVAMQGGL